MVCHKVTQTRAPGVSCRSHYLPGLNHPIPRGQGNKAGHGAVVLGTSTEHHPEGTTHMTALIAATSGATIATVIGLAVSWIRKPAPAIDHVAIECGIEG